MNEFFLLQGSDFYLRKAKKLKIIKQSGLSTLKTGDKIYCSIQTFRQKNLSKIKYLKPSLHWNINLEKDKKAVKMTFVSSLSSFDKDAFNYENTNVSYIEHDKVKDSDNFNKSLIKLKKIFDTHTNEYDVIKIGTILYKNVMVIPCPTTKILVDFCVRDRNIVRDNYCMNDLFTDVKKKSSSSTLFIENNFKILSNSFLTTKIDEIDSKSTSTIINFSEKNIKNCTKDKESAIISLRKNYINDLLFYAPNKKIFINEKIRVQETKIKVKKNSFDKKPEYIKNIMFDFEVDNNINGQKKSIIINLSYNEVINGAKGIYFADKNLMIDFSHEYHIRNKLFYDTFGDRVKESDLFNRILIPKKIPLEQAKPSIQLLKEIIKMGHLNQVSKIEVMCKIESNKPIPISSLIDIKTFMKKQKEGDISDLGLSHDPQFKHLLIEYPDLKDILISEYLDVFALDYIG